MISCVILTLAVLILAWVAIPLERPPVGFAPDVTPATFAVGLFTVAAILIAGIWTVWFSMGMP